DGDARGLGVANVRETHGAAVDAQFALVAAVGVDASEQLDERGLARAVLAAECVDFAAAQLERHVAQRNDAGKAFGEVATCEERSAHFNSSAWWKPSATTVAAMFPLSTEMTFSKIDGTCLAPLSSVPVAAGFFPRATSTATRAASTARFFSGL